MQVRARDPDAGGTHRAELLGGGEPVPGPHPDVLEVVVGGPDPVRVGDLHPVAAPDVPEHGRHHAVEGGDDGQARRGGDVGAVVELAPAAVRGDPPAELAAGQDGAGTGRRDDRVDGQLALVQLRRLPARAHGRGRLAPPVTAPRPGPPGALARAAVPHGRGRAVVPQRPGRRSGPLLPGREQAPSAVPLLRPLRGGRRGAEGRAPALPGVRADAGADRHADGHQRRERGEGGHRRGRALPQVGAGGTARGVAGHDGVSPRMSRRAT